VSHPPDRSHVLAEHRNPRTADLHRASVETCLELFQHEDRVAVGAVADARPQLAGFLAAIEPGFANGGRLIYVGAGTSGRLGVLDSAEAPPTFQLPPGRIVAVIAGGDAALRCSSEGLEDDPDGAAGELDALELRPGDAVLGIAAGGTTPYVRGALALAKARCAEVVTGMLSCSPCSPPEGCDHLVVIATGPEAVTGSTRMKAGSACKMALNAISTTLMVRTGRVYENLMVDLKASNDKLRDRAARIVAELCACDREAAFALLDRAGGSAKTAVVMRRRGCDRRGAEMLLAEHRGHLRPILDQRG